MSIKLKVLSVVTALSLLLSACGQAADTTDTVDPNNAGATEQSPSVAEEAGSDSEQASQEGEATAASVGAAYQQVLEELGKAGEGQSVDFAQVITTYESELQSFVQKTDADNEENLDQTLTTALEAGKEGSLEGAVVKQLFDKLMQKVFYLNLKHELAEAVESWSDTQVVDQELAEAREFAQLLQGTVEKRDNAYGTQMVSAIEAGFAQMEGAVQADNVLEFQLGRQVVDKTLMKTFYLAVGALPNGYASKAAAEAKEDEQKAKVEQAEGWAFFQSIKGYLQRHAEAEANFIDKQFNLETDVKSLDPEAVNQAFVRGFAQVALHEYEESEKSWGEDQSVITALEGALFIDIISSDLVRILGEEGAKNLNQQAQRYLDLVKSGEKEPAMEVLAQIRSTLQAQAKS